MSGSRAFSSMERIIAPNVPGCPEPTITQFVRAAAIEVCERTLMWRYEQPVVTTVAGTYLYDYSPPSGAEVCGVFHATLDSQPIKPMTLEEVNTAYPDWPSDDTTKRAQPMLYTQLDPDQFALVPVPDASTYSIKMFLALRPTPAATEMDATAFDELEREIEHAALQRLLVLPDKSWTDRELAVYHAKQLSFKLAMRRAKANIGVPRGSVRVRNIPWA